MNNSITVSKILAYFRQEIKLWTPTYINNDNKISIIKKDSVSF